MDFDNNDMLFFSSALCQEQNTPSIDTSNVGGNMMVKKMIPFASTILLTILIALTFHFRRKRKRLTSENEGLKSQLKENKHSRLMAECEISCLEKRISKMEETFHLKSEELAKRNEDLLAMSKEAQMLNKRLLLQKKENDTLRQQLTEKDNLSGLQKEIAREEEHLRNLQSDIDSRKKQVMTLRAKLETTTGTDIMLELHAKSNAAKPEPMDETDALLLENHFFTTDKHFYEKIMSYKQQMSKLEWILCQLVRANFKNAEISRLTAKNPSTISNLKRRTFEKIFHKESNSTTEFDQWILS